MQKIALIYLELPQCDKSRDIDELQGLASTANAEIVLTIEQKRTSPDPVTIVGSGKLDEIKAQTALFDGTDNEIDLVLFSVNLGAAQRSAIEKKLDKPVIDRIDLILDIFAMRATTAEGKTQVDLRNSPTVLQRAPTTANCLVKVEESAHEVPAKQSWKQTNAPYVIACTSCASI